MNIRLGHVYIDKYCYSDNEKRDRYENYEYTDTEIRKAKSIEQRLMNFIAIAHGFGESEKYRRYHKQRMHYRDDIGYISFANADRDITDVYSYGKEEDIAFINMMVSYEFEYNRVYGLYHQKELFEEYKSRFHVETDDENYKPFFYAELAVQDFKKFYGENIPKEIIRYYEDYLELVYENKYEYNFETNKIFKTSNVLKKN